MKVWILTEEYNQYDQYGEYYVACFKSYPTRDKLIAIGINEFDVEHVLSGGGRRHVHEDHWYYLREEVAK